MRNHQGTPIWYELQSADPAASKAFYDRVIGWSIAEPNADMDYRMIETGSGAVGGVMRLTDEMAAGGAKPGWLFYVGVDDVDATAEAIKSAGGAIIMGPWDMPGVGRMAVAIDPQGIPFYIMRGAIDAMSTVFDRSEIGKCSWNELITPDQASANAFYASVFGWSYPDKMTMPPPLGDYWFVQAGDTTIGATMQNGDGYPGSHLPPGWRFYFRAPDIDAAAATVKAAGGAVVMGPNDVPGGDRIILATDPHGAVFGVVATGSAA